MTTELFDTTMGYDEEPDVQLSDGLTEEEIDQAIKLYKLFNKLWGVCIMVGDRGKGKDLWGNIISYKIKRYFPFKRVLRDERPREPYGEYAGLFSDKVLVDDLARMKAVSLSVTDKKNYAEIDKKMDTLAAQWVTNKGEVLLKNSVLYLVEYWNYCYNRYSQSPMNKTMGAIHKMTRHLDCLVLGSVQLISDLDTKTTLPFVDWKVTCNRSEVNPTGFVYHVNRVTYNRQKNILLPIGKPFGMAFDAGKPRSYLGDGKIRVTLKEYNPVGKLEKRVYGAIQEGAKTYEELVDCLRIDEEDILWTLKLLRFGKKAISYLCFFDLYNSKSSPQIKSTIKVDKVEE